MIWKKEHKSPGHSESRTYIEGMHIMIVNFNLHELSRAQYEGVCEGLASTFAAIDGLISKHWLANEETNTYGGVYVWKDRQAMLDFKESALFGQVGSNPALINITVTDFEVLESPSKVTGVS
jgi:heme-degrading monooxygenase HmoA|tara:strand:- start:39 stop:404 length:366 start_codon:yes stop_codon:yes gene_type:complete